MGISGPKNPSLSKPNSLERGSVDQNGPGRFAEGGVGIGTKKSRPSAELEKIRVELRQKRNFMLEQKRILEYLEKGGDPLEFRHEDFASPSVQSTSLKCKNTKRIHADGNE